MNSRALVMVWPDPTMTEAVRAYLSARTNPIRMVIFDCDGVLIDSEALCDRVVAASITEHGWVITPEECHRHFLGLSFYDMVPIVAAKTGKPIGTDWVDRVVQRLTAILATEVEPISGAYEALTGVTALGLPWRIASNSSHTEMNAKFARVGWSDLVRGRVHSAAEIITRCVPGSSRD